MGLRARSVAVCPPKSKSQFGLLLLFPICGLIIGGGNLASRILLSSDPSNYFVALTAMLLNVVPFFFIPTLVSASFAAMGNIGGKISGLGDRVAGAARGSEAYKDKQVEYGARDARLGEGLAGSRFGKTRIGRSLLNRPSQKRGRARAVAAELKQYGDGRAAENLLSEAGKIAARAAIEDKATNEDISNREVALDSKIAEQKKSGGGDLDSDDKLIARLAHADTNQNERYAIARHLSGYKAGVQSLSKYINGEYKDANNNSLENMFRTDRGGFSSAMRASKNFGNIGKFSPDLEEYALNTNNASMKQASAGASISASKISTTTSDSLRRMWDSVNDESENQAIAEATAEAAARDEEFSEENQRKLREKFKDRRQNLINAMYSAATNENTKQNIKDGAERDMIKELLEEAGVDTSSVLQNVGSKIPHSS